VTRPVLLALPPALAGDLRAALLIYRAAVRRRGQTAAPDLDALLTFLDAAGRRDATPAATSRHPAAHPPATSDHPGMHQLLTYAEAAEMAGCSTRTLQRRVAAGQLPAVRLGPRTVRIRPADLTRSNP
jgi:excisionase family DNA binding protein